MALLRSLNFTAIKVAAWLNCTIFTFNIFTLTIDHIIMCNMANVTFTITQLCSSHQLSILVSFSSFLGCNLNLLFWFSFITQKAVLHINHQALNSRRQSHKVRYIGECIYLYIYFGDIFLTLGGRVTMYGSFFEFAA